MFVDFSPRSVISPPPLSATTSETARSMRYSRAEAATHLNPIHRLRLDYRAAEHEGCAIAAYGQQRNRAQECGRDRCDGGQDREGELTVQLALTRFAKFYSTDRPRCRARPMCFRPAVASRLPRPVRQPAMRCHPDRRRPPTPLARRRAPTNRAQLRGTR